MPATITYGVEIECYVPRSIGQQGVADALSRLGINAFIAGYGGRDYRVWQIKTDGSLNQAPDGYTGIEVVSPILTWNDDTPDADLIRVSEYLVSIDARVNASCGGHVHMSVNHLDADGLASLVESYYGSKVAIGQMLTRARANGTGYAMYRSDATIRQACDNIRTHGVHYASDIGYHGAVINADWYSQRGTLEFRQREASTNHYKIRGWVGFLVGLVRAAEQHEVFTCATADDLTAQMIAGDYLSPVLADWVRKVNLPRITVARIQEARAAATARVSRLMSLQGVR